MAKSFEVTRDFDWSPRPNIVRQFKQGQTVSGLTRACIARGNLLNALREIKSTKEQQDG